MKLQTPRRHLGLALALFTTAIAYAEPHSVTSPNGEFRVSFDVAVGRAMYSVHWREKEIIAPSRLGFVTSDGADYTKGYRSIVSYPLVTEHSRWKPVWGERSSVVDHYNTTLLDLNRAGDDAPLSLEVRAYNEGVAFRDLVGTTPTHRSIRIKTEETEFQLGADHPIWAVYSAQGKYSRVKLSEVRHSVERPCIIEPGDGSYISVAEAALVDYSRMRLRRSKERPHTLVSRLHDEVVSALPLETPWRVVMAADSAGRLLENNHLILNLNQPNAIQDTSWIRPGKVIREVSLSTNGAIACVDFAVKYGLQYIEFDAGWYGPERDAKSDARTVSRRGLDLQKALKYAKEKGIGVIVYVNRRHLERQLDELLPLYKEWGISGIKFGFVQHGSQKWTAWMHDAIAKCAKYQIMVDVHDEYRMTGWERTYPNFMTAEGIGGDETRPPHRQVLANLFNRMICGPADHTFCYYVGYVDQTSSHASQLAKAVCIFSPWQFLFWYDRPKSASDEPELQFFKALPTTWDELRVPISKIGEYAVVARRKGDDWFVGCLNTSQSRSFDIPLDFLSDGATYRAEIYRDDPSARTKTRVGVETREVDANSTFSIRLGTQGGAALRIVKQ
ncbi:MAG: glycoside hydrolase family 97 N-terminal domain-containing protein [Planctomycetota bacterium]